MRREWRRERSERHCVIGLACRLCGYAGPVLRGAAADTLFSDFSVRRTVGRRQLVQPKFSTDELGYLLFSKDVVSTSLPRYTSPSALSPGKRIHAAVPVHVAEKKAGRVYRLQGQGQRIDCRWSISPG